MSKDNLTSTVIDLLLEANALLKHQAEERQTVFKRIIQYSLTNELQSSRKEIIKQIEDHLRENPQSKFFKKQKLELLNDQIKELEQKEKQRENLIREIKQQEANEASRDELIEILQEYVDLEEAAIYRLVSNYSEAQEILEQSKEEGKIYELLSSNDPRLKAIEILRDRQEGISSTQLSYMLNTSQFQASKIINELIEMGLVARDNYLLKFVKPTEIENPKNIINLAQ